MSPQTPMPTATLSSTGAKMPLVGLGLWQVPAGDCADTVYNAIKAGYRLFDGACDYSNEKQAGEGVARAIKEGLVKREELFITSKLWNTFHAAQHVEPACRRSLDDWGLEYFDLYLIHFPISLRYVDPKVRYPPEWYVDGKSKVETENSPIHLTWPAMESLVDKNMVKNIGVSNFAGSLIMDLMTFAKISPAVLQIEMHPFRTQTQLVEMCKQFDIKITAYTTFGVQSRVDNNSPLVNQVPSLFKDANVVAAANAHKKTPAQVLLRWCSQRGVAVIPKSTNPGRLAENLDCNDFDLTQAEIDSISALNNGFRFNDTRVFGPHVSIFA